MKRVFTSRWSVNLALSAVLSMAVLVPCRAQQEPKPDPAGIATGDKTIKENPELVQHFVNATLRGLKDMLADPDEAFTASLKRMPELSPDKQPLQKDVLSATIDYYQPVSGRPLGGTDPAAWPATQDFLKSIGVINSTTAPTDYYTTQFTDAAK